MFLCFCLFSPALINTFSIKHNFQLAYRSYLPTRMQNPPTHLSPHPYTRRSTMWSRGVSPSSSGTVNRRRSEPAAVRRRTSRRRSDATGTWPECRSGSTRPTCASPTSLTSARSMSSSLRRLVVGHLVIYRC